MERRSDRQAVLVWIELRMVKSEHFLTGRADADHGEAGGNPLGVEGKVLAAHDGRNLVDVRFADQLLAKAAGRCPDLRIVDRRRDDGLAEVDLRGTAVRRRDALGDLTD